MARPRMAGLPRMPRMRSGAHKKRRPGSMPRLGQPQIGTSSPHPPGGPSDAMMDQSGQPSLNEQLDGLMGGTSGAGIGQGPQYGGGGGGGGQGY